MSQKATKSTNILQIVVCGMMLAADVALSRLASVYTGTERFGLSLFAVAVVAYLYGPIFAGLTHALADIVGVFLFPQGAYFPGFTVTAIVVGVIYGIFLYRKAGPWRILFAVVITQVVCTLLLNTLWLSLMLGKSFWIYLPGRLIQSAVTTPVQLIGLPLLLRVLKRNIQPLLK